MEIFGFEIKRKSDEEKAPTFVAPINDDGAQVVEIGHIGVLMRLRQRYYKHQQGTIDGLAVFAGGPLGLEAGVR